MNIEQFQSMLEEKGITLSSRQLEQFEIYFETLVEWNEKMNLTAITEKEEVYLKHFLIPLQLLFITIFLNHSQFVMLAQELDSQVFL